MSDSVDRLDVDLAIMSVINLARIIVYPVETVGAVMTLWEAHSALRIAPGQTRVVTAAFRDENGERVAAVDVVEPVATTDFTVNEFADGSGVDYTSSPRFSLDTVIEATRAIFTMENTAIGPLFVTMLQIRGKPIRVWDAIEVEESDSTSQADYEVRAVVLDLPMQSDEVFAQSYAEYLIGRFKEPFLQADDLVVRSRLLIGMLNSVNVFQLELMDKIVVDEQQSGADMLQHWIRGVEYEITGQTYQATLYLERADDRVYWLLGKANFGELGSVTRLAF